MVNLPQLASRNQIKPYRVNCLSERRGEFWVYLGDRGQFHRRKRRRYKKSIRLMSEAQLYAVIEGASQKFARQIDSITERICQSIIVTEKP